MLDAVRDKAADEWSRLDEAFYDYPDDLTGLLYRYVQDHEAEIRGAA